MTRTDAPLSVALFATNDPRNYSGGRYMSLMMAYALAHAGCRVTFYTDHLPSFDADLSPLAPGQVDFVVTGDFRDGVVTESLDWVVLIPTGIFLPSFYEAVTDHAAACGARLAVVNFESANWYNATSPHPRDARLWDSWRRACLEGALVLSIAREGLGPARDFYVSPHATVQHDVWYPPINSPLAEQFDGRPRRPLIVSFVRPSDPHKGGLDLLALPPGLLAGHELALVAGRDIDPAYLESVQRHFAAASGARISVHTRISDAAKLQMLSEAKLLLFPSYFEGYGYPPVEALYCGTPVVCYDLPVLRETVGEVAYFAPPGDNVAFAAAAAAALGAAPDPVGLRRAVHRFAHFPSRADALVDLLMRHADAVPVRRAPPFRCSVGPVAGTKPRVAGPMDMPPLPAFPFHLTDAQALADGQVAVTALVASPQPLDGASATADGVPVPALLRPAEVTAAAGTAHRLHVALPAGFSPEAAVTVNFHQGAAVVSQEVFRLRAAAPAPSPLAPCAGVLALQRVGDALFLHAWVLAEREVQQVALSLGSQGWVTAEVNELRPELAESHPDYPSYRAGFALQLPIAALPAEGLDVLLLGERTTLGALPGWLRADADDGPVVLRRGRSTPPALKLLQPANLNNEHWLKGVSLFGDARAPSVFAVYDRFAESLKPGSRLRFASGIVAAVVLVQKKPPLWNVFVDRPLNPFVDGYPANVEVLVERTVPDGGALRYAEDTTEDPAWLNGVCIAPGERHRLEVRLVADGAAAAALETGAVLRFAGSGERTVLEVDEYPGALVIRLDAPVGPVRDGAPHAVKLVRLPDDDEHLLLPLPAAGWPGGVRCEGTAQGRVRFPADGPATGLQPRALLQFGQAGVRVVTAVVHDGDAVEVTVDGPLDAECDGAPRAVHVLSRTHSAPRRRFTHFPVPEFTAPDPFHLKLAGRLPPESVTTAAAPAQRPGARPRVLFLTLVPPIPANQGNRVVTRNLIAHLVELGYDVDVVLQGWADMAGFIDEFGDRARLYQLAFPAWNEAAEAKARFAARDALRPIVTPLHAELPDAVNRFHPYFIVRDETVQLAAALLQATTYDSIVCNYLHMARVVKELEADLPLPRTCVITHDALSSLTRRIGQTVLDTMYRDCTPATERDALNGLVDGVVVAISEAEQRYFRDIGVQQPIVLCEYDAAGELAGHVVDPSAFAARTLIYSASRNPLNLAGLGWFLDECWPAVLEAVPDARLIVSGPICGALPAHLPGVELAGDLSRASLLALMRQTSLAINPCVVGTGLKIKTVEAVCLGLPSVCLPAAVDGLEAVAGRFAITVSEAADFAAACIRLLTDEARWRELHEGGLAVAQERFSHDSVYRELDAVMGWTARPTTAAGHGWAPALGGEEADPPMAADPARSKRWRREHAEDAAVQLSLARDLAAAGEPGSAHHLLERICLADAASAHFAAVAARLAMAADRPWLAALHAARLVAGPNIVRPEGFALMGEALLATKRPGPAVDALLQAAAIDPDDEAVRHLLVEALRQTGQHQLLSWALRRVEPPLALGETRHVAAQGNGLSHLVSGWSQPEAWGVWSEGEYAVLEFTLAEPVPEGVVVTLAGHGFQSPAHPRCRVALSVGSTALGTAELQMDDAETVIEVTCPGQLLEGGRKLVLSLHLPDAISPETLGLSPDQRRLGLGLHSVKLDRATASA